MYTAIPDVMWVPGDLNTRPLSSVPRPLTYLPQAINEIFNSDVYRREKDFQLLWKFELLGNAESPCYSQTQARTEQWP